MKNGKGDISARARAYIEFSRNSSTKYEVLRSTFVSSLTVKPHRKIQNEGDAARLATTSGNFIFNVRPFTGKESLKPKQMQTTMIPVIVILVSVLTLICAASKDSSVHPTETRPNFLFSKNEHLRHLPPRIVAKTLEEGRNASIPWVSVLEYGAKGDNATDCTQAFQKALDSVGTRQNSTIGGGVVYAPPGWYVFQSSIVIPSGVTLQGSFTYAPSHKLVDKQSMDDGTFLIPIGGRGDDRPTSRFIEVQANAALTGLVIYHKEQERVQTPISYPWSVMMTGSNAAIADVELLNSWKGINATRAARHYIARIHGQPIHTGIFIDSTYDIGRMEDVQFNPWYSQTKPFYMHQILHGRAFVFGRTDWEYVFNTFAYGYAIGYHFIDTSTGSPNGNFLGIGADIMTNASVLVESSKLNGILITNGEFSVNSERDPPGIDPHSAEIVTTETNEGPVKLVNCAFWGPSHSIARISGSGVVTFSDCQFWYWAKGRYDSHNLAALRILSGSRAIITSNVFYENKPSIEIAENASQVIVSNNMFNGTEKEVFRFHGGIEMRSKQTVVYGNSFTG
jgi:Pectate lyase superfamily protein